MKKCSLVLLFVILGVSNLYADGIEKTMTIIGLGELSIKPDLAILNLTIESEKPDYMNCVEALNKKTDALKKMLTKAGFSKTDIKTTGYNVSKNFRYDNQERKSIFVGFKAYHSLIVSFTNEKELLDKAFNAIGNSLSDVNFSLNFDIKDKSKIKDQLIALAVKDARNKAQEIEKYAGIKLEKIVDIQYNNNVNASSYQRRSQNMEYSSRKMMGAASDFSPGDIEAENIRFSEHIKIVWELK